MPVKITLLTAPDCHLCDQAKSVLERVSRDTELSIETISMETDLGRQLMIDQQLAFPPGLLIEGEAFSFGRLSERRLRRHLNLR
jgi:glutaredoxin